MSLASSAVQIEAFDDSGDALLHKPASQEYFDDFESNKNDFLMFINNFFETFNSARWSKLKSIRFGPQIHQLR